MSECSGPTCEHSSHATTPVLLGVPDNWQPVRSATRTIIGQYPAGCQTCGPIQFLCWKKGHTINHTPLYKELPYGRHS